jgi:tetratricopeptide (TPR) repeat protein
MLLAETGLLDDLDKNMPVWSEDISRPGSMRFTLNLSGNSKASSIYSISPARGDFLDAETKRLAILGISFLESGELGNAEILFKRSISMLDGKQSGTKHLDRIHLQTHIAVIRLYRGRYHDAKRDFDLIEKEMDSLKTDDESGANFEARNEITRWSAISLLHQGQYIDAVAKFEKVLAKRREAHSRLEKAIVGDIQVRRDLALAYGYLGQYTEATKHIKEAESSFKAPTSFGKGDESVKPSMNRTSQAINRGPTNVLDGQIGFPKVIGKGYSVVFASAVLDMLWGEYQSALKKATLALQGICEKLGRKHPRTLELASLKALLLAYNSKYLEAEVLCKDTLQVLADKLGREHPLTLETWGSLVYIFRAQSRFAEALDTANSLCKMTETSLSADHPQTLRAKSLLAAVHFSLGEYHSAERAIQQVVKVSEERYGNSTPDTLRYRSELARVLYLCGRIDEAKAMALDVIKKQREIYSPSHGQTKGLQKSTSIWFSSLEPQKILDRILRDIDNERRTFKQHPSLVFTLQTIATIEMQTQNADINLAQHLLKTVVNRRTAKLGSLHALTLLSQYELASVLRENDQQSQGLEMAREMFHHVWEGRSKLYSITHPETLSAKRELIITHCVCGIWQNGGPNLGLDTKSQFLFKEQQYLGAERCNKGQAYPELTFAQWADVEYVSLDIFNLQDTQLGPNHPETLKSLLWLFTVRLLLHGRRETNAMSTADMILRRLRQETVRSERLIEALRMEEKVALILADQGYYLEAIEILNDVAHTVTQYGSIDPALRPGLETVQRDVAGDLSDLKWRPEVKKHQEQMTELHAGWISAFDEKNFSVAEEKINQVYKLSKLLLGKESEGTLSSLYELALTKWAKSSLEDEREAFDIISRLNSLYEKHLSPDLRNNVRSKEKLWSKSISDRSELEQKEKNLD